MTPEIFHHKGVCQATSFRDRTSKLDFLAGGASTRGVTLGSIMLFYSSPARIVATPLSTRHLGHQSPSHQLGHVLHCDTSGRGSCEGCGCLCGKSFAAVKKSDLFVFSACNHPGFAVEIEVKCQPKKTTGFFIAAKLSPHTALTPSTTATP